MHAFVTSAQLLNAADELLPLTAGGQPALPADTLAGQQAEVQAMILRATAGRMVPDVLEWERRHQDRGRCYFRRRIFQAYGSWEAAYPPSLQPLGGLLLRLLFLHHHEHRIQSVLVGSEAAQEARSARGAISQQLQRLQPSSGLQVLTAEQLEAELHHWTVTDAITDFDDREGQQQIFGSEVPASVAEAVAASTERLLVLEPNNPRALLGAAAGFMCSVASSRSRSAGRTLTQRCVGCLIAALRVAEAAHSPYYKVRAVAQALPYAAAPGVAVSAGDLAALIAAAEQSPAAVKWLKGVLPHSWVARLQAHAEAAQSVLPAARMRLQHGNSTPGEQMAILEAAAAQQAAAAQRVDAQARCVCSGCGKQALGLRRCARCKQAACEWGWEVGCIGSTGLTLLSSSSHQL